MGQARQRGTFEERRDMALARGAHLQQAIDDFNRQRSEAALKNLLGLNREAKTRILARLGDGVMRRTLEALAAAAGGAAVPSGDLVAVEGAGDSPEGAAGQEEALEDTCGLCGEPGADKIPHPIRWPGEKAPETELVHAACEAEECARAHAALSEAERDAFLRSL